MKPYFALSFCVHIVLLTIVGQVSISVYNQIEYDRKKAAAQEHIARYRQAKKRNMVDEMEVILDIMKRIEDSSEPDPEATPFPNEEKVSAETNDELENPENLEKKAIEIAEQIEALSEAIRAQEEGVAEEELQAIKAGLASDSDAISESNGQSSGSGGSRDIASLLAEARENLQGAIAAEGGLNGDQSSFPSGPETGRYWSDFALDKLGGRSADEFNATLDTSELSRNANQRSQRFDNHQLRAELNTARLEPSRSFFHTAEEPQWSYVDTWYTIGPFDNEGRNNHATPFPPETIVDLDAIYSGKDEQFVEWTYLQNDSPMIGPPGMEEYTIHYAYTELRSSEQREVWFAFGSDDSVKAWLNDELIWESEIHLKPWDIADGFIKATLKPGYNTLLLRLENAWGPGFFSASIRTGMD